MYIPLFDHLLSRPEHFMLTVVQNEVSKFSAFVGVCKQERGRNSATNSVSHMLKKHRQLLLLCNFTSFIDLHLLPENHLISSHSQTLVTYYTKHKSCTHPSHSHAYIAASRISLRAKVPD